ncbi:MAG: hypothetical protein ACFFCD_00235 [Promethearchaeota archaeon]
MLHNVYIFKENGICLFTRKYGSLATDANLVSGFLSAISNFGQQIGTESLKRVDFGNYRVSLINTGEDLITAGVIDKNDDLYLIETVLKRLTEDFKRYYATIKESVDGNALFESYSEKADEILQLISSPDKIITQTRNLTKVIKQLRNKFAVILEVLASRKPLVVCSETRETTELYVHSLAKLLPIIEFIPWTEDEELIFSIKEYNNVIIGVPLKYVMKLAEDETLSIINLAHFRIHGNVKPSKNCKDIAKYASKQIDELGEEGIYSYIQAQMEKQ